MAKFYKCFKNDISEHVDDNLNSIENALELDRKFNLKHSWFYLFYLLDKNVSKNGFIDYFKSNSHSIENITTVSKNSEVKDYFIKITKELIDLNNLEDDNCLKELCNILEVVSFDSNNKFLSLKTSEFFKIKYDILELMDHIDC